VRISQIDDERRRSIENYVPKPERALVVEVIEMRHPAIMLTPPKEPSHIPNVSFDDLDPDLPEDEEEWERRLMAFAAERIAAERLRMERLGIIDANGDLVSHELPPDMLPDSDTTL
jgi:hypothetical protein